MGSADRRTGMDGGGCGIVKLEDRRMWGSADRRTGMDGGGWGIVKLGDLPGTLVV